MKKLLFILVAGLFITTAIGTAYAIVTVPMELDSWTVTPYPGYTATVLETIDGLKLMDAPYRKGVNLDSNFTANFSDSKLYFKWMAHGPPGDFMGVSVGLSGAEPEFTWGNVFEYFTLDHSFDGSHVAEDDTWYYTTIEINSINREALITTAQNNYYSEGGTIFKQITKSINDYNWGVIQDAFLHIMFGDNYGGVNSWVIVAEVKYDIETCVSTTEISPTEYDFGGVELNDTDQMFFTLSTPDITNVTAISLDATSSTAFNITLAPVLPLVMTSADLAEVAVSFTPTTTGPHTGELVIETGEFCPPIIVPLYGEGVHVEPPIPDVEVILTTFDNGIADGTIIGDGPGNSAAGRMGALYNMIKTAGELIAADDIEGACRQLMDAYNRCDGEALPPDFITGASAPELAAQIMVLMDSLGCE